MRIIDKIQKHMRREKARVRRERNAARDKKAGKVQEKEFYEAPERFPEDVEREVKRFASVGITQKDINRRRDMRNVLTFTIDPENAKDFDDALSFAVPEDGVYQIGIHIADVTHYVQEDTAINDEAYRRGTSVYLVDKVVPMLPERLSNDLCSLRPHEDKLCMSVIVEMDSHAKILRHKICRTVIQSDFRLDYGGAQAILDGTQSAPDNLQQALQQLHALAQILRQERFQQGAIDFDHQEVCFHVDETGRPTDIYFHPILETNHLIEEFMLLANRLVATDMGSRTDKPFVYRVHDNPDPDKMGKLGTFIKRFGLSIKPDTPRGTSIKQINLLLDLCKGLSCQTLVETLTIRAMAKAVYSTHNIGHFGLCFPYYTHFTSPIRRYPDMMVHRIISKCILGERGYDLPDEDELEQWCEHCSETEQNAQQAERDSIRQMQAMWMENHIGEEYDGIISGVTDYGLFVQLHDTLTDGLIHVRTLCRGGDYMQFDEDNYCLISALTGKTYTLSDEVRVRVIRADVERRQVEFVLVQTQENN